MYVWVWVIWSDKLLSYPGWAEWSVFMTVALDRHTRTGLSQLIHSVCDMRQTRASRHAEAEPGDWRPVEWQVWWPLKWRSILHYWIKCWVVMHWEFIQRWQQRWWWRSKLIRYFYNCGSLSWVALSLLGPPHFFFFSSQEHPKIWIIGCCCEASGSFSCHTDKSLCIKIHMNRNANRVQDTMLILVAFLTYNLLLAAFLPLWVQNLRLRQDSAATTVCVVHG